jgi:hypothetical protein
MIESGEKDKLMCHQYCSLVKSLANRVQSDDRLIFTPLILTKIGYEVAVDYPVITFGADTNPSCF